MKQLGKKVCVPLFALGMILATAVNCFAADADTVEVGFDVGGTVWKIMIVFIVLAVALAVFFIVRVRRNRSVRKVLSALLCVLLVIGIVFNAALYRFHVIVNTYLTSQDSSSEEIAEAEELSREITQELESEGIVLLKNSGDSLPLEAGAVNLFGYGSYSPGYGGAGSGGGDSSGNVSLMDGLEAAGFTVNEDLVSFYENMDISAYEENIFDLTGNDFSLYDPALSEYGDDLLESAAEFSDTAIVVITRVGGEGGDLPMDMDGYVGGTAGRHYLELGENEEELLAMVEETYETVIVIVNSSHAMELGFLEDEAIDAAIWIGGPGSTGMTAVGQVLAGEVNPSGRLVDTYAYDVTTAPSYYNFGDYTYTNTDDTKYVEYAEGIYVGYRYYETRYIDNETGECDEEAYQATVQYPFGYGLSYTTFEKTMGDLVTDGENISVDVTVTNTGSTAGKEVVQIYYTAPYTVGGIEKSHVVLAAFGKTDSLEPGESQTLTLSFVIDDMSSFDYEGAGCYVLEAGDYEIKLMNNAHDVIDTRTYTVDSTITYSGENSRSTDVTTAETAFTDAQGDVTYVSRADWEGTLPTERSAEKAASDETLAILADTSFPEDPDAEDIVIQDNGLVLSDLVGLDYDDEKWDQLLEQLSVDDMEKLISNGGFQTVAVSSVSKPATSDSDGPAGLNNIVNGITGVQYCSEVVIASTWNAELVERMGETLANELTANNESGLYAPAANTHRSPFGGRNFEYYSEDGLLAGKMAAAVVQGAKSKGVFCYMKHFALNDQETNRDGVLTWANEQAIREIYLRPFEIAVKEGGTTAIMSSFNYIGATWAAESYSLLTTVLRSEWGFQGTVVTDAYMSSDGDPIVRGLAAGNDMALSPTGFSFAGSNPSNTLKQNMRNACHNILYTVANSNVYDTVDNSMPWWIGLMIGIDIAILLVCGGGFFLVTRKKTEKDAEKQNK